VKRVKRLNFLAAAAPTRNSTEKFARSADVCPLEKIDVNNRGARNTAGGIARVSRVFVSASEYRVGCGLAEIRGRNTGTPKTLLSES